MKNNLSTTSRKKKETRRETIHELFTKETPAGSLSICSRLFRGETLINKKEKKERKKEKKQRRARYLHGKTFTAPNRGESGFCPLSGRDSRFWYREFIFIGTINIDRRETGFLIIRIKSGSIVWDAKGDY